MTLRVPSTLPDSLEHLVTRVIGCGIQVHRCLGPGLREAIYEDALTIELELVGLAFDRQREVVIYYRDRPLRPQRLDLVVENQIVLEIKAVDRIHQVHQAQLLSYVCSARLRIGLLMNFNAETLKGNIKRVVV